MCARQGLGKVRRFDVQELWIQQRVRNGDVDLFKVAGETNPGELFTKASLTEQRIRSLTDILGCEFRKLSTGPETGGWHQDFCLEPSWQVQGYRTATTQQQRSYSALSVGSFPRLSGCLSHSAVSAG